MASKNQKKKNNPISALAVIIIILGMSGVGAVLIPFIIAGAVVYYYVIKKNKTAEGRPMFDDMPAEAVREEPLSQSTMFSKSEAKHLATMKGPAHNEYEHYVQELRDLLAAGIIEKDEYRERVERLRRDPRV